MNLTKIVMRPLPGTNEVVIYDDSKGLIERKKLEFPKLCQISEFLNSCAWVNIPGTGKLYISGGLNSKGEASSLFLSYSYADGNIVKLSDMIYPRYCHSMCYSSQSIYVVGGSKNNTTEKYDLNTMKWSKLANLNYDEKLNPILYIHNNIYLYSFFGYQLGNYLDSVEKLKINNPKAKWEIVPYKNAQKINLKIIGCGIVSHENDNHIYFIGGQGKTEQRKKGFSFEFNSSTFSLCGIELEDYGFYQENLLIKLGESFYGQFNTEDGDHFLKVHLNP
jgi:hypothetical protein